ncbi:hypothetical protein [Embleya sp. NPDC050493]|uniref:hypothetical protein n=1 Tax=Embleya sp. NPDC050493 TaxID=3363989 RepID=UPI0037B9149E
MTTTPAHHERRDKHLELLQSAIGRFNTNSFLIKGWAMTLNGALVTIAPHGSDWTAAVVALLTTIGFWLLDSYYLGQERRFRSLYERAVTATPAAVPFFTMDADQYGIPVPWRTVALSRTMLLCYGTLTVVDTAVLAILARSG